MVKLTNNKHLAIKKLYAQSLSAQTIAYKLSMSLHQVYDALIAQDIPRRNTALQNKIRFEQSPLSFSFKKNLNILDKELLAAGVMLYNGEGAKTGKTVDFTNSNIESLKVFLTFLRKVCRVDEKRLRFYLYCFSDQDSQKLIDFWCKNLEILRGQFTQPYVRDSSGKGGRTMQWGVLHIRYSDKRLLAKILSLSQEITNRLVRYGKLPK